MKRLFVLLIAAGSFTFASAQSLSKSAHPSYDDSKYGKVESVSNDRGYGSFSAKERDREIKKINREFDARIASVRRSRHMRSSEKSREIRILENQRDQQIRMVNMRFTNSNRNDKGGYSKNDRRNW
ncbi:MAG: hypothetical protein WCF67_20200 [Chitinophagaceae bacterium]